MQVSIGRSVSKFLCESSFLSIGAKCKQSQCKTHGSKGDAISKIASDEKVTCYRAEQEQGNTENVLAQLHFS